MADLNATKIHKMKVAELKEELEKRGLTAKGTKAQLAEALLKGVID